MILAFTICWGPFGWVYVSKLLGIHGKVPKSSSDIFPLLSVKLGCTVINPTVYGFEKTSVRELI